MAMSNFAPRPRRAEHGDHKRMAPSNTPLADTRFQELLRGASAFFAANERDVEAEKAQTIKEIKALMSYYNITIEDLIP